MTSMKSNKKSWILHRYGLRVGNSLQIIAVGIGMGSILPIVQPALSIATVKRHGSNGRQARHGTIEP